MLPALDAVRFPDDLAAEPSEGDKAGDKQWTKLPTQNGAINFAEVFGETPIDPYLTVTATYQVPAYIVTVRVEGTARAPKLHWRTSTSWWSVQLAQPSLE